MMNAQTMTTRRMLLCDLSFPTIWMEMNQPRTTGDQKREVRPQRIRPLRVMRLERSFRSPALKVCTMTHPPSQLRLKMRINWRLPRRKCFVSTTGLAIFLSANCRAWPLRGFFPRNSYRPAFPNALPACMEWRFAAGRGGRKHHQAKWKAERRLFLAGQ